MNLHRIFALMAILMLVAGCQSPTESASSDASPETGAPADVAHADEPGDVGHTHEPGDELVWEAKEKIDGTGFEIWMGHHGSHFHAGDMIEPSVAIMRDGKAFADAAVFNQLVEPDYPTEAITEEVATVYEPETDEEIAHYAQGKLEIPADGKACVIRFRIEILELGSLTRDMKVKVGH